ncbi:MAG: DUF4917 family protein [Proteobacteria bacterium]|nr:DUF4917 family protein [Pseudomonadota bacterium]
MTLLTYEEVKNKIGDDKNRALLLGNGFSMSYDEKRFSFANLLDSAIKEDLFGKNSPAYKTFEYVKSVDFEEVIKFLESPTAIEIINSIIVENGKQFKNKDAIIKKLKKILVDVITINHPEGIMNQKSHHAFCFIGYYKKIYTLNYDLLLYWLCLKLLNLNALEKYHLFDDNNQILLLKVNDGFFKEPYNLDTYFCNNETKQTIFYLHGGLHIYNKQNNIIKITHSKEQQKLSDQIRQNIKQDNYPLFVSEGSSDNKKNKITNNNYLNHCYKNLANGGGENSHLVIFGTKLKTNDNHIKDIILKGKFENIYIGIKNIDEKELFADFEDSGKNIIYYDYQTVKVWG